MVATLLLRIKTEGEDQLRAVGAEGGLVGRTLKTAFAAGAVGAVALGAGLAASAVEATKFNSETLTSGNNALMSSKQIAQMREEVLKLGTQSSQSLESLTLGFERAADAGFHGKDAYKIVQESMKAAAETGGQTNQIVDTLVGTLKQFGMGANESGKAL